MGSRKIRRNDQCSCGSGRKFKQCCARKQRQMSRVGQVLVVGVAGLIVAAIAYALTAERTGGSRQVWDPVHGHYHTEP